jgi:LemA protein
MMMDLVLIAALGVLALVLIVVISVYNRLVGLRQSVLQGRADIDAQLRQRHDLIPNLVETVKSYAAHESATLDAVVAARNAAGAGGQAGAAGEQQLRAALGNLLALGEAYPDLKASANFQSLQAELGDVEDKLAAARRALNAAAARYNAARESLPAVLFAGSLGFAPADFHQLEDGERGTVGAAPRIAF